MLHCHRHRYHHRSKSAMTTHSQPINHVISNDNNNHNPREQIATTKDATRDKNKRPKFLINDHVDILIEILKRLDGRSLCVAACVCRLWCTLARTDSLWEHLCFRHVSSPPPSSVRPVVVALGGYKRLYMVCLRPVLSRLNELTTRRVRKKMWTRDEVQLSLSLFCVDYYERLGECDAPTSSLMFLCNSVNV